MARLHRRNLVRASLLAVLALSVALTACGRRGPLEPPSAAAVQPDQKAQPAPPPAKPDKPFVLDPLLH